MSKLSGAPIYCIVIGHSGKHKVNRFSGGASDARFWLNLADKHLQRCIDLGVGEVQFKNPFGVSSGDMPFFGRRDAREGIGSYPKVPALANVELFKACMDSFEASGIRTSCYLGSPNQNGKPYPLDGGDVRWQQEVYEEIRPILQSCSEIGFDAFFDFPSYGEDHRIELVQAIELRRVKVRCEPFPMKDQDWALGLRWQCSQRFWREFRKAKKWHEFTPLDLVRDLLHTQPAGIQDMAKSVEDDGHRPLVTAAHFSKLSY